MHTQAREYVKKGYICGDILEEYIYSKPVRIGDINISQYFNTKSRREAAPRSDFSISRSRKNIRRLVNSNPDMDKFLTLTFAENITDLKSANYEFKKFKQKLERVVKRPIKYICVPEFQKRGAVHYHIMSDMPYIYWRELSNIWGHGRIQIEQIRKRGRAGAYISKYIRKQEDSNGDSKFDIRYYCQKAYFFSKGTLNKAKEVVDKFLDWYKKMCYDKVELMKQYSYEFAHHGTVTVSYYLLT